MDLLYYCISPVGRQDADSKDSHILALMNKGKAEVREMASQGNVICRARPMIGSPMLSGISDTIKDISISVITLDSIVYVTSHHGSRRSTEL